MLAKNLDLPRQSGCRRLRAWRARPDHSDVARGFRAQPHGVLRRRRSLCRCTPTRGSITRRVTRWTRSSSSMPARRASSSRFSTSTGATPRCSKARSTGSARSRGCAPKQRTDGSADRPSLSRRSGDRRPGGLICRRRAGCARTQKLRAHRCRAPRRARRTGIRPAGPHRRGRARRARALRPARAAASATQSRADPGAPQRAFRICRRSPASIRLSIAAMARLRIILPSRQSLCGGRRRYGFHGLSYEYIADRLQTVAPEIADGAGHRRSSRQRRLDVRAPRRPQRRKHHGLHRSRRPADGHAAGPARSRRRALSHHAKRHERPRRCRICSTARAA